MMNETNDGIMLELTGSMKIPFGKHKGHCLRDICDRDPRYILWLHSQDWLPTWPDVYAFVTALGIPEPEPPAPCRGTVSGQPCPRSGGAAGYCTAHAVAQYGGVTDLHTCKAICRNGNACANFTQDEYCLTHARIRVER